MSSDPSKLSEERNTIFVLTALLLTGIVSISFYNLDRHPAFPPPSDELIDAVERADSPVIFADDPVSLAVLEGRQSKLSTSTRPLSLWPAQAPLMTFGPVSDNYGDHYEMYFEESVWKLWRAIDVEPTPIFETVTVEVEDEEGMTRGCRRDADGAHQCGDASWTRIEHRTLTIDGERERCIWAHPIPDKTLRLRFGDVPTIDESKGRLHLLSGLSDSAVGTGQPVDFDIHIGDRSLSHRHSDQRGWQSVILPTVADPSELQVEVSASDVGRRHICFRFDLR